MSYQVTKYKTEKKYVKTRDMLVFLNMKKIILNLSCKYLPFFIFFLFIMSIQILWTILIKYIEKV